MRSALRPALGIVAALTVAASTLVGFDAALADTPTPTSAATATAAPTATATAAPTAVPTDSASPSATPSASAAAEPTDDASATADAPADSSLAADPSLAVQDAEGNHTMGSTIAVNEPSEPNAPGASTSPTSSLRVQSKAATTSSVSKSSSSSIMGLDVSAYQPTVNFATQYKNGARFAYIKATENTSYKSSTFAKQYAGAATAGLLRGAYHFAHPDASAAAQAKYFVANGGGWSADGKTLPPLLDIEYGGTSDGCWGLTDAQMVSWIRTFSDTMKSLTGRVPAIYAGYYWWQTCTGNSKAFGANALMVPSYGRDLSQGPVGIGASWSDWTIWQYSSTGPFAGDSDVFNGTMNELKGLALPSALATLLASPTGYVDSITTVPGGIRVRGWAIDPDTYKSIKVHVYTGSKVTVVTANKSRPDVATQMPKWGAAHGYDVTIGTAKGSYKTCVYGINAGTKGANALLTSCTTAKSLGTNPVGSFDKAVATTTTSVTASGWAIDGSTAASIKVAVYVDGAHKTAVASATRSDVGTTYPSYGSAHGYSVTVPTTQGTHKVCVYGINVGTGPNSRIGSCKTVVVNYKPVGVVDKITPSKGAVTVSGWAYDPDVKTTSIPVAVYLDGRGARTTANAIRSDVAKAHPGIGTKHGFSKKLSASKGSHKVCVYAIDPSGHGSNPTLKCSTVTVP